MIFIGKEILLSFLWANQFDITFNYLSILDEEMIFELYLKF